MIDKVVDLCGGNVNGKIIAILGVTFKPNTDDMRDSLSLTIVPALVGGGAKARVVNPQGRHEGEALLTGVNWIEDAYKVAQNADAVVILTEWKEFRALDLKRIVKRMDTPVIAEAQHLFAKRRQTRRISGLYLGLARRLWH